MSIQARSDSGIPSFSRRGFLKTAAAGASALAAGSALPLWAKPKAAAAQPQAAESVVKLLYK